MSRQSRGILAIIVVVGIAGISFFILKNHGSKEKSDMSFPDDFLIGTSSSSYQVEGAWNHSDKSESNWDNFVHCSEKIEDRSTGDNTAEFYYKYKEDIRLLKDLGINHFRFSLSWPRILPKGDTSYVSQTGIKFYHSVLDELEKNGIEPFVTIYHWDHPMVLEESGGWLNESMVELFANYSRVVYREFGSRVKIFSTINEPYIYCVQGYKEGIFSPGLVLVGAEYICLENHLKAHARAYHIYDEEFRSKFGGKIGMVTPCKYFYNKYEWDKNSSDIAYEFECGWQNHPIFAEQGDYPEVFKQRVAENSKRRGRASSALPTLSKEWIDYIKGTADYLGLNHYTTQLVEPENTTGSEPWTDDSGLILSQDPEWPSSGSDWLKVVPTGLRDLLRDIKTRYNNPPVYIMESGTSDPNGVDDKIRLSYLYRYMQEMLSAMRVDGCDVRAYTIWSFTDSFEWNRGYLDQFGLYKIDFKSSDKKRIPKKSVHWLKRVLRSRELTQPEEIK